MVVMHAVPFCHPSLSTFACLPFLPPPPLPGLAWSVVDPWQFASLSYDGRVVVHAVPPAARNLFLGVVR